MFEEWVAKLRKASGHQVLSFNWWQGERHLWTAKPYGRPPTSRAIACARSAPRFGSRPCSAMGATATPMPYAEVYSAIEQKAIDSVEVQYAGRFRLEALRGHEVRDQDRPHQPDHRPGDERHWFSSLPADQQKILREEALKAGDVASYGTRDRLARSRGA